MARAYALWFAATRVAAAGAPVRVVVVGAKAEAGAAKAGPTPKLARKLQLLQQLKREREVNR